MVKNNFDYVVARPWYPDQVDSPLAIYAYGQEIQQNESMESAECFLGYVKANSDKKDWAIYKVTFEKVKNGDSQE